MQFIASQYVVFSFKVLFGSVLTVRVAGDGVAAPPMHEKTGETKLIQFSKMFGSHFRLLIAS